MKKSRRDFLKTLAASSAVVPLAGCTSLDQWFMGETRDETDKVLILGAGIGGLAAAYQLKKSQVPFRLFEGSSRIGGRILTVRNLTKSSRHGELGAERIEPEHSAIQTLAQELKIGLIEVNPKESYALSLNGKYLSSKEWRKESAELVSLFKKVQSETYGGFSQILSFQNRDQFPKAVVLDRMSVAEFLDRLKSQLKPWMRPFLESVVRNEWGAEPKEVSALHLLHWIRDSFKPMNQKYFKISGGTSVLTQAVFDRVGGVIPERFVKFQHQLIEIDQIENGWNLSFRTPTGRIDIKGNRIICTLPPALLRQVKGFDKIPVSPEKLKNIQDQAMGTHGKVLAGFQERFWGENSVIGSGGTLFSDLSMGAVSESGDPVVKGLDSLHGVLQFQFGGEAGAGVGPHSVAQVLKELARIESKASTYENIHYLQNWKLFPWSQGSRPFLKPGQFQNFDVSTLASSWSFAGDWHSLSSYGTMNGAVQTGFDAANRFIKAT